MNTSDKIKSELKEISPKLAELPRMDVFNADEAYFEKLPCTILNRIQNKNTVTEKYNFLTAKSFKWVAASIVILLLGSGYYYMAWNSFYYDKGITDEAYVIENFDEEIMTEYFAETQLKSTFNKESVENTLENIDEEILMDEL